MAETLYMIFRADNRMADAIAGILGVERDSFVERQTGGRDYISVISQIPEGAREKLAELIFRLRPCIRFLRIKPDREAPAVPYSEITGESRTPYTQCSPDSRQVFSMLRDSGEKGRPFEVPDADEAGAAAKESVWACLRSLEGKGLIKREGNRIYISPPRFDSSLPGGGTARPGILQHKQA